jgi:hypothetical protein
VRELSQIRDPAIPVTLRLENMRRWASRPIPSAEERRRTASAREALALEREFEVCLWDELRAERWEAEATDERTPLRAGCVHPTTWYLDPAQVTAHYDQHAVDLGGSRWLRNIRLRSVADRPADKRIGAPPADEAPPRTVDPDPGEAMPRDIPAVEQLNTEADAFAAYERWRASKLKNQAAASQPAKEPLQHSRSGTSRAAEYAWGAQQGGHFRVTNAVIRQWRADRRAAQK